MRMVLEALGSGAWTCPPRHIIEPPLDSFWTWTLSWISAPSLFGGRFFCQRSCDSTASHVSSPPLDFEYFSLGSHAPPETIEPLGVAGIQSPQLN
jgi:hypothetical protein